ncbi:MAG: thiolase family protein [Bdellovibrionota bacterium]
MSVSKNSPKNPAFTQRIFINAAYRSPIGKFGGALKKLSAAQLAANTLEQAIHKSKLSNPDYVIMGHARQAGAGPNTARQACIYSGLSDSVPAWTINHACASGMSALVHGVEKLLLSRAQNLWVGGVESMSNTPYLLPTARWGQKLGNQKLQDAMYQDGFFCPMANMLMGETVERFIATERNISRKEQDEWALLSHKRATESWSQQLFEEEVLPVQNKLATLEKDEAYRPDSSIEALAKLPPVFDKEGTLSAGNSSAIVDGAAWLQISVDNKNAIAEILDYEVTALDPKLMGLGPVQSIRNLLERNNLNVNDIEAFEINEAFAAQMLACQKKSYKSLLKN